MIISINGKISALEAKEKAENEYEKYKIVQDKEFISDFDMLMIETEKMDKFNK